MDIKAKIEELVAKIKGDKGLLDKFQKNPEEAVKGLVGNDVPTDQLKAIIEGIKAKIGGSGIVDKIGDAIGGIFGKK